MVIRVDMNTILSQVNSAGLEPDDLVMTVLPVAGLFAIEQVIGRRLSWKGTYAGDISDVEWDYISSLASEIDYRLGEYMKLSDMLDLLGKIEINTRESGDAVLFQNTCCSEISASMALPPPVYDTGSPPPIYGGHQLATWEEYDAVVCNGSLLVVDSLIDRVLEISRLNDIGTLVTIGVAGLMALLSAPAVGVILALDYLGAAELFNEIKSFVIGESFPALVSKLNTHRQELADAIFCKRGEGVEQAKDNLYQKFVDLGFSVPEVALLKLMVVDNSIAMIFSGENEDGEVLGIEGSQTCTECLDTNPCNIYELPTDYNCEVSDLTYFAGSGSGHHLTDLDDDGWYSLGTGSGSGSKWVEFKPDSLVAHPSPDARAVMMELRNATGVNMTLYGYSGSFHTASPNLDGVNMVLMTNQQDLQDWFTDVAGAYFPSKTFSGINVLKDIIDFYTFTSGNTIEIRVTVLSRAGRV